MKQDLQQIIVNPSNIGNQCLYVLNEIYSYAYLFPFEFRLPLLNIRKNQTICYINDKQAKWFSLRK